jgi:N6-L-threonylcarbamoyladenine synthase
MLPYGGVVPEMASREHLKALPSVVELALNQANLKLSDIGWIAVTGHPGLIGALLVGVSYAKALAYALKIPFTLMNHIEAHLFSAALNTYEGKPELAFPWLALVVSGGHTELFYVEKPLTYRWLGGTLDDAAGEAFDKIGKLLGFSYPAGPVLDKLIQAAPNSYKTVYKFPRSLPGHFDFSYSGLKTAVLLESKKHSELTEELKTQLAASAQEAILDPLVERVRKAALELNPKTIVVTGGVACNSRLREKLPEAYFPPPKHCTDNAAMIARLAHFYFSENQLKPDGWSRTASPSISYAS